MASLVSLSFELKKGQGSHTAAAPRTPFLHPVEKMEPMSARALGGKDQFPPN